MVSKSIQAKTGKGSPWVSLFQFLLFWSASIVLIARVFRIGNELDTIDWLFSLLFHLSLIPSVAVDYLLKPIPFARFLKAVNKAQSAHEQRTSEGKADRFFGFKADKRTYRVPVEPIHALESDGDYTHLYLEDRSYMLLGSLTGHLTELEDVLLRVHRSHAVNLAHLEYMEGNFLRIGGCDIPIGAIYREEIKERIK